MSYNFQLIPPVKEVWGKVIFLHLSVSHSVHRGGVPGQVLPWDQVHPHPLGPGTPPDQVHPPGTRYTTPLDQVHPRDQVHPPGPGTPPGTRYTPQDQVHPLHQIPPPRTSNPRAVHAGKYGQQAGGTHPTGMHSCYCMNLFGPVLFGSKHLLSIVIKSLDYKNLKLSCWNI